MAKIDEDFRYDSYRFIAEGIRETDEEGHVENFFLGPQKQFENRFAYMRQILDYCNIDKTPDSLVKYFKWPVGITPDLDYLTNGLTDLELRKLIKGFTTILLEDGTQKGIEMLIRILIGQNYKIFRYFDFQWLMDEGHLDMIGSGDPWLIGRPGSSSYDEFISDLRIMDTGFNKTLLANVLDFMRVGSERINVIYLDFMDDFKVGLGYWKRISAGGAAEIIDRKLILDPSTEFDLDISGSDQWTEYVTSMYFKINSGNDFMFKFACQDDDNFYGVYFDFASNEIKLKKYNPGETTLDTQSHTLFSDVIYFLKVELLEEGSQTRIRIYIDDNKVIDVLDSTFDKGYIGLNSLTSETSIDFIELFQLPLTVERVGPNP